MPEKSLRKMIKMAEKVKAA